jgi:hypothetical protein
MAMVQRCCNPKHKNFRHYGGRGITVCDRWRTNFEVFLEDMGPRPSAKHSIERKDNNGNYEPGNCVWATQREQSRNKRTNRLVEFGGQTLCVEEWAAKLGLTSKAIHHRLDRGWSIDKALTTPLQRRAKRCK